MARGKHRYRISIKHNVAHVREFLIGNGLINGVEGNPVPNMTQGTTDIVVKVPNKRNFETWFSPLKRFREATDPIKLGYIEGTPVKLADQKSFKRMTRKTTVKKDMKKFEKMKDKLDYRKK